MFHSIMYKTIPLPIFIPNIDFFKKESKPVVF